MEFGVITYGGVACFYEVTHTPILMGQGPSFLQNFGTSYMCAHSVRHDNQILLGDQTGLHSLSQLLTLDTDQFAVANLLVKILSSSDSAANK